MLNQSEVNKINKLEEKAERLYLDKTDFCVTDWLIGQDLQAYRLLIIKDSGECPTCGTQSKTKTCKCC